MLAIHWTPVNNTKSILRNGIACSKKGLYCFPLTGLASLDRWWIYFFNQCGVRQRKKYNGIIFRIQQQDLPAYFGHWIGATNKDQFSKEITCLKMFKAKYRETVIWRLGEESHPVPPKRIIKIIPQGNEFGRVLRLKKRYNTKHHNFE